MLQAAKLPIVQQRQVANIGSMQVACPALLTWGDFIITESGQVNFSKFSFPLKNVPYEYLENTEFGDFRQFFFLSHFYVFVAFAGMTAKPSPKMARAFLQCCP